jgi:hypothetical protein
VGEDDGACGGGQAETLIASKTRDDPDIEDSEANNGLHRIQVLRRKAHCPALHDIMSGFYGWFHSRLARDNKHKQPGIALR